MISSERQFRRRDRIALDALGGEIDTFEVAVGMQPNLVSQVRVTVAGGVDEHTLATGLDDGVQDRMIGTELVQADPLLPTVVRHADRSEPEGRPGAGRRA